MSTVVFNKKFTTRFTRHFNFDHASLVYTSLLFSIGFTGDFKMSYKHKDTKYITKIVFFN